MMCQICVRNCSAELAQDLISTRCAGLDEATKVLNRKAKDNLVDCFGDVGIATLTKRDGREFWRWLLNDKGLGENTAKQRLRYAQSFLTWLWKTAW